MKNKTENILEELVRYLDLAPKELKLYKSLLKRPMTIKQLEKSMTVSERMLRTYIDDLLTKRFIKRKIIASNRLKYMYYASPATDILRLIKTRLRI